MDDFLSVNIENEEVRGNKPKVFCFVFWFLKMADI